MTPVPGLPEAVRQRAAELLDGTLDVVPLADAATILLLRQSEAGPEVYMQRRNSRLAFAAGMYVFPGGRLDPQDFDPEVPFIGPVPQPVPFAVGGDIVLHRPGPADAARVYRALVAAAIRETVEEAGVLLAEARGGAASASTARTVRDELERGTPLAGALRRAGLSLRLDRLVAVSHWMTPAVEVRRFDTRFFAALLPEGQQAHSASGESDTGLWVRPADMLRRAAEGEVFMLPPTVAALRTVGRFEQADAVVAQGHVPRLRPVLPHPYRAGDEVRWRLVDGYTGEPWVPDE